MRPIQILDKPAAEPRVCINCGAGNERQFFVDLGFDTKLEKIDEYNHTYFTEGVIYLCSECISSVIVEYNRKLPSFLIQQFISRGFLMDANQGEVKTLQDEISMLRGRLNVVDEENQTLRFALLSKVDQENEVLTPPVPGSPTAESLVDELLGKDKTDGNSTGTIDPDVDGHDSSTAGDDSGTESDDSNPASHEHDSLTATQLAAASGFGATFPPST